MMKHDEILKKKWLGIYDSLGAVDDDGAWLQAASPKE